MKRKFLEAELSKVRNFEHPNVHLEQYPTPAHLAAEICFAIENRYGDFGDRVVADLGCGCGMLTVGAALMGSRHVVGFDVDQAAIDVARENVDRVLCGGGDDRQSDTEYESESEDEDEDEDERSSSSSTASISRSSSVVDFALIDVQSILLASLRSRQRQQRRTKSTSSSPSEGSSSSPSSSPSEAKIDYHRPPNADNPTPSEVPSKSPDDAAAPSPQRRRRPLFDTVVMNPPFGTRMKGADMVFLEAAFSGADMGIIEAAHSMCSSAVYSLHKSSTRKFILKKAQRMGIDAEVVAELRYDIPKMYRFHKAKSKDIAVDLLRFDLSNYKRR